jgi:L-glyceraldehyde 3-phosphate reductase
LPAISLGCWHNFGGAGTDAGKHADESAFHENCRQMLFAAFDLGITHFDLANNYGPPPGSAEERVGRILQDDFKAHRDELIISTKAGYWMWPGPYGEWGSRKYLLASLDASLKRLKLDYVDIFYHHRPDPEHAARRVARRARPSRQERQGNLRRRQQLQRRADRRGHRRRRAARVCQAGHPPAVLQHARALDRVRPAARNGKARRRRDRVLSSRARHPDEQVFEWHPRRLPRHLHRRRIESVADSTNERWQRSANSTMLPSSAASRSRR